MDHRRHSTESTSSSAASDDCAGGVPLSPFRPPSPAQDLSPGTDENAALAAATQHLQGAKIVLMTREQLLEQHGQSLKEWKETEYARLHKAAEQLDWYRISLLESNARSQQFRDALLQWKETERNRLDSHADELNRRIRYLKQSRKQLLESKQQMENDKMRLQDWEHSLEAREKVLRDERELFELRAQAHEVSYQSRF